VDSDAEIEHSEECSECMGLRVFYRNGDPRECLCRRSTPSQSNRPFKHQAVMEKNLDWAQKEDERIRNGAK
jgi:hypothetical protein